VELKTIAAIVTNLVFVLLYAPLLNGVERKIRARIQNRLGPPITQTFYDLAKLFRRSTVASSSLSYVLASLSFAYIIAASLAIPTIFLATFPRHSDIIYILYLVIASTVLLCLASATSSSPFAALGVSREISTVMCIELALPFLLTTIAIHVGSLSMKQLVGAPFTSTSPCVALAVALMLPLIYVESTYLPFEIAEAEPELASGIEIEFGGRILALALYTKLIKRLLLVSLLLDLAIPRYVLGWLSIPLYLALLTAMSILFAVLDTIFARYRPEQVFRWIKRYSALCMGVAILGLFAP